MFHDRRKPLGGVEKSTYVDSGGHPLTYDLIAGLRSELCAAILSVKSDTVQFKKNGATECVKCKEEFTGQYIKKAFGKWPVSIVEFIFYILVVGVLIGTSIINPKELLKQFFKF